MEILKLIFFLGCSCLTLASHGSHNIPIEGYESELQVLGQHIETHEPPVKVIKITKTIAVKIPVPYPVKVIEKVPYPVHIAKPYPVPVPQIVKVPAAHLVPNKGIHATNDIDIRQLHQDTHRHGNNYQTQENHGANIQGNGEESFESIQDHYNGYGGQVSNFERVNDGYPNEGPVNNYDLTTFGGGHFGNGKDTSESNSYAQATQSYLSDIANKAHGSNFGYH